MRSVGAGDLRTKPEPAFTQAAGRRLVEALRPRQGTKLACACVQSQTQIYYKEGIVVRYA